MSKHNVALHNVLDLLELSIQSPSSKEKMKNHWKEMEGDWSVLKEHVRCGPAARRQAIRTE